MNMPLLRLLSARLPVAVLLVVLSIPWNAAQGDTVLVTYKYDRAGRVDPGRLRKQYVFPLPI
jgi:hypothetical protein